LSEPSSGSRSTGWGASAGRSSSSPMAMSSLSVPHPARSAPPAAAPATTTIAAAAPRTRPFISLRLVLWALSMGKRSRSLFIDPPYAQPPVPRRLHHPVRRLAAGVHVDPPPRQHADQPPPLHLRLHVRPHRPQPARREARRVLHQVRPAQGLV